MTAFITSRNSPSVKRVAGKVKITNTGFTKRFRRLITNATKMAVINVSTITPGKM
jgi:hypothetical protein